MSISKCGLSSVSIRIPTIVAFAIVLPVLVEQACAQSFEDQVLDVEIEIDGQMVKAKLSPDGDKIVWSHGRWRTPDIMIANADGTDSRKLTRHRATDYGPDWFPEGDRLVFGSDRSGIFQIYTMNVDGRDVQQITHHELGCRGPKISSTGHLAWLQVGPRAGKVRPAKVIAEVDGERRVLCENAMVANLNWNYEGNRLAIGMVGSIQLIDVESDEAPVTFSFPEKDSRLHAHTAREMQWQPAGEFLGCKITFVGGRMGDIKILGDTEYFVFSEEGEMEIFESKQEAAQKHPWLTGNQEQ